MKALIVDDEKHVRDAIHMLVPWERWGIDCVMEASNGLKAMQMIQQEHPQIIFTDMIMPVKSGVELLQWIHANAGDCKTIVISGHNDFNLVRSTIHHGGMDYILKPIDPDQLNMAVDKAVKSWQKDEENRRQHENRNIQMNQLKPVYWDKAFSAMISNPEYYHTVKNSLLADFHSAEEKNKCCIVILTLDTINTSILGKFKKDEELLYFTLTNICNEILGKYHQGYSFRYWNKNNEILLLFWDKLDEISGRLHELNFGFRAALGANFDFGVGGIEPFPGGLKDSYGAATLALKQRNLLLKNEWIHSFKTSKDHRIHTLHFADFAENIRLTIRSGNPQQMKTAVRQWIQAVKALDVITQEQVELWQQEYNVLSARILKDFLQDKASLPDFKHTVARQPPVIPTDHSGKLSFDLWEEELTRNISELSEILLSRQRQENNVIYEIKKYIESNYHRELTLQDIASHFYLSREYISRKFKQELHENVSEYISRIRMEKAKVLLLNPNLKIAQISRMVGFQDEKYFSKVFKKTCDGLTPNEYRKTR